MRANLFRFLWVHFQIVDICDACSDAEIREVLSNLPYGLGDTYSRILMKINRSPQRVQSIQKIFKWIVSAKRPLNCKELCEAAAFNINDRSWSADKIPDADKMIESCRGLVIRDDDYQVVSFAHHTFRQYLLSGDSEFSTSSIEPFRNMQSPKLNELMFSLQEADQEAGQLCITYLSFSDFETAIAPRQSLVQSGILANRSVGRIPGVLGFGQPFFDIPYRLLGGRPNAKLPNIDYAAHLNWKPQRPPLEVTEKYALLDYIVKYWAWHSKELKRSDNSWRLFQDLVLNKTLPFEFRPWGSNQHFGQLGCRSCPTPEESGMQAKDLPLTSMLHWSAKEGNMSLLSLEVPWRDYFHHERYHQETLMIACRNGRLDVVTFMLPYLNSLSDGRAINVASRNGHHHVVEQLLVHNQALATLAVYDIKLNGHIALQLATANGYEETVRVLLEFKARWDEPDDLTGETLLHVASRLGHVGIVRLIFKAYFDTNWIGSLSSIQSDLIQWRNIDENDHATTRLKLRRFHEYVDFVDFSGETALIKAASGDFKAVVAELLKADADASIPSNHSLEFPSLPAQELGDSGKPMFDRICLRSATTAAHIAVARGNLEILSMFPVPSAHDPLFLRRISNLFYVATAFDHAKAFKVLHAQFKSMLVFDSETETTVPAVCNLQLHFAAQYGRIEILELLLHGGTPVDSPGPEQRTALHYAAYWGHEEAIHVLAEAGANVQALTMYNSRQESALSLATIQGHEGVVSTLIHYAAIESRVGVQSSIRHAINANAHKILRLLLEARTSAYLPEERKFFSKAAELEYWGCFYILLEYSSFEDEFHDDVEEALRIVRGQTKPREDIIQILESALQLCNAQRR